MQKIMRMQKFLTKNVKFHILRYYSQGGDYGLFEAKSRAAEQQSSRTAFQSFAFKGSKELRS